MMSWTKKGVIFAPDGSVPWMATHASLPVVDPIGEHRLRIYFASRDQANRSHLTFIEVDAANPSKVVSVNTSPILAHGPLGTFDDNGIAPSWIINTADAKYLYYIGWNPQVNVSYRLSIGLAISCDGGKTFQKVSQGPIADRSLREPYFCTAPCVLKLDGLWKMWYVSCTGWSLVAGKPEPSYHIKYTESSDGIMWDRHSHVCIDYCSPTEAIGRPCVYIEDGLYKMIYSFRSISGYRDNASAGYRLGYAESRDGAAWTRMDSQVGITTSATGWDSQMIEYCYVCKHFGRTLLFYNGNGFGKTGIGYAELQRPQG